MEKKKLEELIDESITFISTERELYGDFTIPKNIAHPQNTASQDNQMVSESSDDEMHSESSKTGQAPTTFDAQEDFFNRDDTKEIYYQIEECQTLDELKSLCEQADVLHTDLEGTRLVFGVGNPDADLVLVGEAPGAEEDKKGEPFVGRAGQLLNKILDAINFERDDIYITNILKHRPPNNRNPNPEERKHSLPFLLRQIELINPKLILSLGKVSTQTLLDKNSSLSSMRGTFHPFREKYQLLATYHPAALLRNAQWKRPTWEDVQLLRERYDELDGKP